MVVYYECRKRIGADLYKVRTWYLLGLIPLLRRHEQLTVPATHATPSELIGGR